MSSWSVRWLYRECEASPVHAVGEGEVSLITKSRAWVDVNWESEAIGRGDCPSCPVLAKCGEFHSSVTLTPPPPPTPTPASPPVHPSLLPRQSLGVQLHTHSAQMAEISVSGAGAYTTVHTWPTGRMETRGFGFQSQHKLSMNKAPLGCACDELSVTCRF